MASNSSTFSQANELDDRNNKLVMRAVNSEYLKGVTAQQNLICTKIVQPIFALIFYIAYIKETR